MTYNSDVAQSPTPYGDGRPSVLVLTLFSGEAEFDRCRESLERQSFAAWSLRVFEHLPNAEAHSRLYATIAEEAERYDLFFKLDADMILADDDVLADLVHVFQDHEGLDHLVVAVSDWMTDSMIIGAHMFSNRVRWVPQAETLYVDPDPVFPGRKLIIASPPRDLILHASNPSALQAFHFGAHRALQASQVYRRLCDARPHNARLQWQYLDRVWGHFERTGDRRLGLAVMAADMVFTRQLSASANEYSDRSLLTEFGEVSALDVREIRERLEQRWGTPEARRRTWREALGPMKYLLVGIRCLRDATVGVVKKTIGSSQPKVEIGTSA